MKPLPSDARDVLVVGGGVFGTTASLELTRRGRRVTLLDPGPIPHAAASSTDVSKMVRMDYGADRFYHALADEALSGWDRWNADWPTPLYHETGFLVLASGPMAPGGFEHDSHRVLLERGYTPDRLDAESLARHFPAWDASRYPDGYLSRRGGWAESGAVVARLAALCEEAGIRIVSGRAEALMTDGARIVGVRIGNGTEDLLADEIVVCAGAWTSKLVPWLADVMWATAQPVLHLRPEQPERFAAHVFPPFAADIAGTGWYGFPALPDGRVKIAHHGGGRRVDPAEPGDVSDRHVARTRAFLANAVPGLADAEVVGRRACMYCDTFDGDLWIDRDPDRTGLVVAAGGSGHAFKFAPVLGGLIANAVDGTPDPRLRRFRWRARGTPRQEAARFEGA